ncbi:MAG TPA: SpvB/TcaC N-terminal domain-containing protein, partial [Xanthomonadales bacterium]|nr:SpvB/TcaC N-terminal domain-containing protein [Xanthomonadales bacterium]
MRLDLVIDEPSAGGRVIKEPPVGQIRSSSSLAPGRWHNPNRLGHGWSFFWKNRLALPESHPLHGDAWDLVGLWYTYELRGGIYRPVFAELSFTSINAQYAQGTVWITRNGHRTNVGSTTLTFQSDTTATIDWSASFLHEQIAGIDPIEMLVAPDSDPIDNHSHYSGLWESPSGFDYLVSHGLGWISESVEVVFEDEDGQPSWIIAEGDDPVPGHTDLCFYYVSEGVAPGTTGDIRFYNNGCDSDQSASLQNRNGFRRFIDFEEEEFWVDFHLPGGTAPDEFVAGSPGYPHPLTKVATFHRIEYESIQGSGCELDLQTPQCEVNLTWHSDGNYPQTSVYVHDTVSGGRALVGTAMTGEQLPWSFDVAGEYQFELRMGASENSSLMAVSDLFFVTGSAPGGADPEVPPLPAPAPDMTPTVASSETGATIGQFDVSPAGGASYNIPVLSAPGSGGMSPSVSLAYDIHAGNGPLGVGWSIDGFSVISRCAQTFEQDGNLLSSSISFSGEDRFCLDGERLMAINGAYGANGTEYRKERDDHTRVISYGIGSAGPSYFKAWNRDGVLYEFGRSDDSRIETRVEGIENVAFAWAQNRVEDTAGNYIDFSYSENSTGPVDFVLESIHYTGNQTAGTQPYAELRFQYQTGRNDSHTTYVSGVGASQTRLLHRVDSLSRVNETSPLKYLRSYQLDYGIDGWGRSVLQSVTECRDQSFAVCFAPTQFTWQKSEHQVSSHGPDASSLFTDDFRGLAVGDVNGDGRADLLITERNGSDFDFFVALGSESGHFSPVTQRYYLPHGDDPALPVTLTVIDLNADGNQDVLFTKKTAGDVRWHARLAGPNGLSEEFVVLGDCCDLLSPALLQVMDYNGDGLSDIMTHRPVFEFEDASEIVVLLNDFQPGADQPGFSAPLVLDVNYPDLFPTSTATGWELADETPVLGIQQGHYVSGKVDDFYGDGSADILVRLSRLYRRCLGICRPNGPDGAPGSGSSVFIIDDGGHRVRVPPGGDPAEEFGLVTFFVVFISDAAGSYSDYEILATGAGDDCKVPDICNLYASLPEAKRAQAADINADGLADAVFLDEQFDWYYRLNTGAGFLDPSFIGQPPNDERAELARFIDISGDGFPEMIYPNVLGDNLALWMIQFNDLGHGFSSPQTSAMPAGNTYQIDNSAFLDFSGDGMIDQLFIDWRDDGSGAQTGSTRLRLGENLIAGEADHAINAITNFEDGYGASFEVTYSPLTDPEVYTRMNNSAATLWGRNSAVYDLVVPFHVVSKTRQSAPVFNNPSATAEREYHYVGAKLQAGGRGLLGFAEIVEWNPQNQLRTHTLFRQEFPFLGLVAGSRTYLSNNLYNTDIITDISDTMPVIWPELGPETQIPGQQVHGVLISSLIREYNAVHIHSNENVWALENSADLDREFALDGTFKTKTFITRDFDSFGNMQSSVERKYVTDNLDHWSKISTSNQWINDSSQWRLGRLAETETAHWRSGGVGTITRKRSFGYHPQNDLLIRETSEPGHPVHQVVTDYELDEFGNRTEASVTGVNMATRSQSTEYDQLGRFVIETRNPYNQATLSVNQWDEFGNVLQTENIDGVDATGAVDWMGRPFATYGENGSWSVTESEMGGHARCPSGTAYHALIFNGGTPNSIKCFDRLRRNIRTASQGFLGGWIYTDNYYDLAGQPERLSEPYFAGEARYWNFTDYDELGRVNRTTAANGLVEEVLYDNQATHCGQTGPRAMLTRVNPQDGTLRMHWERKNASGETERILDHNCGEVTHQYDAVGNLVRTEGIDHSVISVDYDGLGFYKIQMSDP